MKVVLVSSGLIQVPPVKGGAVELYVYELCESLRKLGVEAYVIDRAWKNLSKHEHILRVKVPQLVDSSFLMKILGRYKSSIIKEVSFGFAVAKLIKELDPDIVHVNTAWAGFVLFHNVGRDSAASFIYTCHNPLWPEEKVSASERIVRFFEGSAMKRADAVIALNETMRRALMEKAGLKPNKIFVVPNGVDTDFFKPGLEDEEICRKYNLEGKYRVLFVGRVTNAKGVHILLRALKIVREKYGLSNIKAIIVGPLSGVYGDDKPSEYVVGLQRYTTLNNLDVTFTGSITNDELRYIYSYSHVLVLPSYFEAFSMVLLEAMASGLPVIGSRAGGIVDIIEDDVNGFLFTRGSPDDLAEKLYLILSDNALRQRLSVNSRLIAETRYSWNSVAAEILKIYKYIK